MVNAWEVKTWPVESDKLDAVWLGEQGMLWPSFVPKPRCGHYGAIDQRREVKHFRR